jgi:hypothetical protein
MSGDAIPVEFIHQQNVTPEEYHFNLRANAGRDLPSLNTRSICVCASGPSLADHLGDVRARKNAGWSVASMNGSHNFLIENGIVPDYMFMVDARPVNLPFLRLANDHTTYVIASQCRPEIFEALQGRKVVIWQMFHTVEALRLIQDCLGKRNHHTTKIPGSLNVGQSCLNAILQLGYRRWHLFGYDGSMKGTAKHAFPQPQNEDEPVTELLFPLGANAEIIDGVTKNYFVTPTMAHAADFFSDHVDNFRRLGIEMEIIGEGLIPDIVAFRCNRDLVNTVASADDLEPQIPPAKPRKRAVERLPVVTFKWKGHIPYYAEDVNRWASGINRHLKTPHELVLITDDGEGVDGAIRQVPLWRDNFEHGRDWHRVKLFAEEMADIIGPRFVVSDLDTVFCGQLDPLFNHDLPFMAWRDPNRDQYCTALFIMDAGAFPHVWERFDPKAAFRLRQLGLFGGYDQAWISHALPGQPRWTDLDGVLSFRKDILNGMDLEYAPESAKELPDGARVINFHGKYNPRDPEVQAALPWIAEHYR